MDLFERAGLSAAHAQHLYGLIMSNLPIKQASLLQISEGVAALDIDDGLMDNIS